jgi:hypothetical protein
MRVTAEQILCAAWSSSAPGRDPNLDFPRGFWPDIARLAVEMALQDTLQPNLDFTPTRCAKGNFPQPANTPGKSSAGKISPSAKAANTAALLAAIKGAKS